MWVGTSDKGLLKLDTELGAVAQFEKGSSTGENLRSNRITALEISNDQFLWIGTDVGLNLLNLSSGTIVVTEEPLASASISTIYSSDKEVLVGTEDGGLYQWRESEQKFSKIWSTSSSIMSITRDHQNRLWIGTGGRGLYMQPSEGVTPEKREISARYIYSLFVDSNQALWVGTMQGLALYDEGNDSFQFFVHSPRLAESLVDDHISALFEDRSRMLWIGTEDGGTSRFNLDHQWFPHIRYNPDRESGLRNGIITAITSDQDGKIWIGSPRGIAVWDGNRMNFSPAAPEIKELGDVSISAILIEQDGTRWFGTNGEGLIHQKPDGSISIQTHDPSDPDSLSHNNISAIYKDQKGRLFIGTSGGGLLLRESTTGKFSKIATPMGSHLDFISNLTGDADGNLWIASPQGLYLLKTDALSLVNYREAFTKAPTLASTNITCVLPDTNHVVWIGTTDAGLIRLDTGNGQTTLFTNAIHGLPDNQIMSLIKDRNNLLWVTTRKGIARLNALQNEFRIFSGDDGLQTSGFSQNSVTCDHAGRLYFGGLEGFNIIDPEKLPAIPRIPTPILTSFEYFGESVLPKPGGILERKIAATNEIRLSYDPRMRFGFRFANLDFRYPNRGYFRYRLDGLDPSWVYPSDDRKASYNSLGVGSYTFLVQSSLDGRNWSETTARVRVIILPPWWQTWWALSLGGIALIGGMIGSIRFSVQKRVRQLQYLEEKRIAQQDRTEAALSRELQNGVLLGRARYQKETETELDQEIMNGALDLLVGEFSASQALVFQLVTEEVEKEGGEHQQIHYLQRIGYAGAFESASVIPVTLGLDEDAAAIQSILDSQSPVTISEPYQVLRGSNLSKCAVDFRKILAIRTSFLDAPNGAILLFQNENSPEWGDKEKSLLTAIAAQFGITIAQISTAETERKYRLHLEDARHQAEVANRAKSDFLAKMTHELRTPLTSIIGFTDILAGSDALTANQKETIGIIKNSGNHLLEVVNEILDLSKIEAGRMERIDSIFDFHPFLTSLSEMLSIRAKQNQIGFAIQAPDPLPMQLFADRSKLRQVLINLVGNAIKFTAQGAVTITIYSDVLSKPEEHEGRIRRKIRLRFEVRDTGRGISEEEIPKLFERYSQTESGRRSSEGTGLGLPIAHSFLKLMDGDVNVESTMGVGTVFRLFIECYEIAPAPAAAEVEVPKLILNEESAKNVNGFLPIDKEVRILIVEDHQANRMLLRRILGRVGFQLEEAGNGEIAVEKWRDWKPDLILMDEEMPIMKGTEATTEIRSLARPEDQPVIVSLTANAFKDSNAATTQSVYSDAVTKPFKTHELLGVIAKHLGLSYTFAEAA